MAKMTFCAAAAILLLLAGCDLPNSTRATLPPSGVTSNTGGGAPDYQARGTYLNINRGVFH